jgi:hypothetical protein
MRDRRSSVTAADRTALLATGWVEPSCEVPCHVYLDRPLGERTVIDGTSGREVPHKNVYAMLGQAAG